MASTPPPSKRRDIRSYFPTVATDCGQETMKEEDDCASMVGQHLHQFTVKFGPKDTKGLTTDCHQLCTVLEAIKADRACCQEYKNKNFLDGRIAIQMGKEDRKYIIATHFPCSCLKDGTVLTIFPSPDVVEDVKASPRCVLPRDEYAVFYIDREGGQQSKTKTKSLFRNNFVKKFKLLVVYGEKGTSMTVKDALRRDGRFHDDLGDFRLSNNDESEDIPCTRMVDNLHKKELKICLQRINIELADETLQISRSASKRAKRKCNETPNAKQQSGVSIKTMLETSSDTQEIYKRLREQYPELKRLMEARFPGESYQTSLALKRENFGKIRQSFSEVHRLKKLLKLGESVCKINVGTVCEGTGFVLFENFILTNAHLFENCCAEDGNLQPDLKVYAVFDYDEPPPDAKAYCVRVKEKLIDFRRSEILDYAILELALEDQKMPPGLLKKFGPKPETGEACIIGHPGGQVKQIDPICIIEREKRLAAAADQLASDKNPLVTICKVNQIKTQGIESIMVPGAKADEVVTYNTFMYHGSSGSPVFDAHCRVFGLHTAGFFYDVGCQKGSVIEFCLPLKTIIQKFVAKLRNERRERGGDDLLWRVQRAARGNKSLKELLGDPSTDDSDSSMEH